jgi:hypothetical protein
MGQVALNVTKLLTDGFADDLLSGVAVLDEV